MLVSDIYDELVEITGNTDETVNLRALTRGIEMLANKGAYDPLIGYLDFMVAGGYWIALPADVKTPLRININSNPSFARSKLFEFSQNTDGTVEGQAIGWTWDDKGYSCLQDETKFPGNVKYYCASSADNGKTATLYGTDADGRQITETLVANSATPTASTASFYSISKVIRAATTGECSLAIGIDVIARYYKNETEPSYRVIKLSKTGVAVRMMYRKHVFKITSQSDIIVMQSSTAVLLATRAARFLQLGQYAEYQAAISTAVQILNEEQASREENVTIEQDVITATNINISTRDSIIVADVYDDACAIMGPIGRDQIFDEITTAIEVLSNKAQWDSLLGYVDIQKSENLDEINPQGKTTGNGYFVLPRYVDAILSINLDGHPVAPRNGWFEFHINGTGERNLAGYRKWDSLPDVVTVNRIPLDPDTRSPIPQKIVALPDSDADNGTLITIYGFDANGRECVMVPPCVHGSLTPDAEQPLITRITRITKAISTGCIKLVTLKSDGTQDLLLGYYYPDEVEPKYRAILLPTAHATRIRARYRKRTLKVSGLYDPIPLRSRLAITTMLRALKAQYDKDIQSAATLELLAVNYLREERMAVNPGESLSLQFDVGTCPAHTHNIT